MSTVIDCDSHVMEPADLWQRYLEPTYRDRAIRIERREGVEHLIIGEVSVLSNVLAGLGGAHLPRTEAFSGRLSYADGCEPASWDPAARTALLDNWGVDRGVLFPTIGILPFPTDDTALANAYCRAYNRWQREFFEAAPGRVARNAGPVHTAADDGEVIWRCHRSGRALGCKTDRWRADGPRAGSGWPWFPRRFLCRIMAHTLRGFSQTQPNRYPAFASRSSRSRWRSSVRRIAAR